MFNMTGSIPDSLLILVNVLLCSYEWELGSVYSFAVCFVQCMSFSGPIPLTHFSFDIAGARFIARAPEILFYSKFLLEYSCFTILY